MKKYEHLKQKALELRTKGLTIDEICLRIGKSKSTVYHWIKDVPIRYSGRERNKERTKSQITAQKKATEANKIKHERLRNEAYELGMEQANKLLKDYIFRDFINIYLGEGFRKTRHVVKVANSNPNIIKLSKYVIENHSSKQLFFELQHHEDQDVNKLKKFWAKELNICENEIKVIRKSNSNKLTGRNWASKYGVCTVGVNDTYLRAKVQAWMDYVQNEWEEVISKNEITKVEVISERKLECSMCSKTITNRSKSNMCNACFNRSKSKVENRPSRIELIELILTKPFLKIGNDYDVSDNAIRKWCKFEGLPTRKVDIDLQRATLEKELADAKSTV